MLGLHAPAERSVPEERHLRIRADEEIQEQLLGDFGVERRFLKTPLGDLRASDQWKGRDHRVSEAKAVWDSQIAPT